MHFTINPMSHIPNPNESHLKNFLMQDNWQYEFLFNALKIIDSKPSYTAKQYEQLIAIAATNDSEEEKLSEIQTGIPFECDIAEFEKDSSAFIYFNICNDTSSFTTHYIKVANDVFLSNLDFKDQKNGLKNFTSFQQKVVSQVDPEFSIRHAIVSDFAILLGALNFYQQNRDWLTSDSLLGEVFDNYNFFAVGDELRIAIFDSKHNYLSWLLAEAQNIVDNVVKYPLAV